MGAESIEYLLELYNNIDVFFVIIFRLLGFFIILPVFSGVSIPNIVKLGFSVLVAAIVFSSGKITEIHYYDSVIGYIILGIGEFFTGILLGFVVFMIFSAIYFAGQLIDFQIGFSMVSVFDPVSQIQVPIMGNFFYLVVCMILIVTGGLHSFIAAIFYSYETIQPGMAKLLNNSGMINYLLELIKQYFVVGVKISMPIVGSILIVDIALGILVKAVPQMNVFVVGMPMKLLLGLTLLFMIINPFVEAIYDYSFELSLQAVINMIRGLSP